MVKITCETAKGGAVKLNEKHGVWASYAVATAGSIPPAEIFYAGVKLPGGSRLQLFVNRETGLVVVDLIGRKDDSGVELLRTTAHDKIGRRWVSESLENRE